jgi:hypothetical protein
MPYAFVHVTALQSPQYAEAIAAVAVLLQRMLTLLHYVTQ